nr:AptI [Actinoallomurus sp. ID145808]
MGADSETGTAVVFPGMGPTNFADLAKFMLINPFARKLTKTADEVLGYSLIDRYRATDGDYTEFSQVSFLVTCLALAEWAEHTLGMRPEVCAGPSFGGRAATVYSGGLAFPDAVRMTARWANHVDEYFAREHTGLVTQSFLRTPEDRLAEVLRELDEQGEWYDISCYVDHDIYLLSLREERLDWLQRRLRSLGGMPVYTMRPPMHSRVFGPLRDQVEEEVFGELTFTDPRIPVVADQDGSLVESGAGLRTMLLDGFVRPVRWPHVVATLTRMGVGRLFVSGRDHLFGRVACTTQNFEVVPVAPATALQPRRRKVAAQSS